MNNLLYHIIHTIIIYKFLPHVSPTPRLLVLLVGCTIFFMFIYKIYWSNLIGHFIWWLFLQTNKIKPQIPYEAVRAHGPKIRRQVKNTIPRESKSKKKKKKAGKGICVTSYLNFEVKITAGSEMGKHQIRKFLKK